MRRSRTIRLPDVAKSPFGAVRCSIWSHPVLDPSLFPSSRAHSLFDTASSSFPPSFFEIYRNMMEHMHPSGQYACEWRVSMCEECRVWRRLVARRHSLASIQARLDVAPVFIIDNAYLQSYPRTC